MEKKKIVWSFYPDKLLRLKIEKTMKKEARTRSNMIGVLVERGLGSGK